MLGHRKMSGEDKSKEAVTAEGQNTKATLLRTQTSLWMQSLTWFQGHIWEKPLEIRSTGSYRQTTSGSGNPLRYIWRPVQCSGSVMLTCLEAEKGGKSGLSLAQEWLYGGQKWCAGHGVQGSPSHQQPTSCAVHAADAAHTAPTAALPLGSVRIMHSDKGSISLEERESHPDEMVR